jgi:vacuolar-type H+-ATPase subunit E/Vma4
MTRKIYNSIEDKLIARKEEHQRIVEELRSPIQPIDNETPSEYEKRKDEAQQKLRHYLRQTRIWDVVRGL